MRSYRMARSSSCGSCLWSMASRTIVSGARSTDDRGADSGATFQFKLEQRADLHRPARQQRNGHIYFSHNDIIVHCHRRDFDTKDARDLAPQPFGGGQGRAPTCPFGPPHRLRVLLSADAATITGRTSIDS